MRLHEGLLARVPRPLSAAEGQARGWAGGIGLAVLVGVAYFLAARLGVGLLVKPEGVAVFWPAAGVSSGVLIALGPRARWPVVAGVMVATVAVHQVVGDPLWASIPLALSNAVEPLITAGLIRQYFGGDFDLDRLRQVLGLLIAAIAGTAISGIGGAVTYRLSYGPSAAMLTTWRHWFASDVIGIVIVAPLVIGLAATVRRPPPRNELAEGAVALVGLAAATGIVISLPPRIWTTVVPIAGLFPILSWIADHCRPVFAAAAAFLVSITIVSTAVFGVGHFGDSTLQIDYRILQAQAAILFVALGALVLAALFAERRESEARLVHSNLLLERERDNKLMNAQAITAAIAHEVRQPLTAIVANANAALRWLGRAPPDHDRVRSSLDEIVSDGHRTNELFNGLRALFGKGDRVRQSMDVNEIILAVLRSLRDEFKEHRVELRSELTSEPAHISGNRGQIREVISNLVLNAIEAMDTTTERRRVLRVRTELRDRGIAVMVSDSGPGIDPSQLARIFTAFATTKPHGMGLGLAISQMIVENHGGQLTASSDGRSGASFQFVLPIDAADQYAARAE
jgi:signal transduction histidine kinase